MENEINISKNGQFGLHFATMDAADKPGRVTEKGTVQLPPHVPVEWGSSVPLTTLPLSKTSTGEEIRSYFNKVLALKQSGESFPVNLDEVWPLVYERKDKAVNELLNTKNEDGSPRYMQDIDYQAFHQMVQAGPGLSKKIIYKLSIPCVEWFIARKVRPIFEVYRQVFHEVATARPITAAEQLLMTARALVEHERAIDETRREVEGLKEQVRQLDARTTLDIPYYTIVGYVSLVGKQVDRQEASRLGKAAANVCRNRGIYIGSTYHPCYGRVNTYPAGVLEEIVQ
jgi:hypothetical protein